MNQIGNTKPHQQDQLLILNFLVQKIRLCIDINHIKQVLPLMQLDPVPRASACMVGLMNLAGKSIPVIDLAWCLGLERVEKYTIETPILLCNDNNHCLGVIVDSIFGLEEVSAQTLQLDKEFSQADSPFLGVIESKKGLSLLMNMKSIFLSYVYADKAVPTFNGQWPEGVRHENT